MEQVLYNGLPLDLSLAGYLSIIPGLLLIVSIWITPNAISKIFNIYYFVVLFLITLIGVTDIIVYPYWSYHIDSSAFLYLASPKEILARVSSREIIVGILSVIVITAFLYLIYTLTVKTQINRLRVPKKIGKACIALLTLIALLFIPIKGGINVAPLNTGRAYFSNDMFLNQAATNPQFNLIYSVLNSEYFGSQYEFYENNDALRIYSELHEVPRTDSTIQILNIERPNIIMFILENIPAKIADDISITPNIHQFRKEGITFDNFYANNFRTDRDLISILSGYPTIHPTKAITEYPAKMQSLPSIPKLLGKEQYDISFYYGGNIDYANMRSYLTETCLIDNITSDESFELAERQTKWGVPDKILLEKLYTDLTIKEQKQPFFKTILTSNSNQPFYDSDKKLNKSFIHSISYTDSCLGDFVNKLKTTDLWEKTLIIFVADHGIQSYCEGMRNSDRERFEIPMIWTGGVINQSDTISDYGSQVDIAATLLSQMKIDAKDFKFSKNILNPHAPKYAFYSFVNGFSMIDSTGYIVYDNNSKRIMEEKGNNKSRERDAKVTFQNMYIDLEKK